MPNHRPTLINKLADTIWNEIHTQRTSSSKLGDKFEFLKSRVKMQLSDSDLRDLCLLTAATVVDANATCKVQARRPLPTKVPVRPSIKDKGR